MSLSTADAGSYLALDPGVLADPYPLYEVLRREGPPIRESTYGVWLVSRYADIQSVVRRPELFSSIVAPLGPSPDLSGVDPRIVERLQAAPAPPRTLVTADPPDHTRFRSLLNRFVNLRRAQAWEPRIREIAEELVEGFAARGSCELIADFAGPFPLRVVAELLGMPEEDHAELRRWADAAAHGIGNPPAALQQLGAPDAPDGTDSVGFADYFSDRIASRRRAPIDDDLVSELVHARTDDGQLLDDAELLSILGHFLVAGHETSTKMIATGMLLLVEHRDQMDAVRADPSLCAGLVEESLRFDAPVQGMFRVATADTEVAGVDIPCGATLMLMYGSGNRDDDHFPDAARFDLRRANARAHLSFGQGVHLCAGAPFARAEGRIGFDVLLSRLSDIRLSDPHPPLDWRPSFILRGLSELHLTFTPSQTEQRR